LWDDAGLERVSDSSLVIEEAKQEFQQFNRFNTVVNKQPSDNECTVPADSTWHETVGAVAVDSK
jgi:isoaspartyl peptidase/L-asparaginase-like protein (Ntn-hydrolase superfamily)